MRRKKEKLASGVYYGKKLSVWSSVLFTVFALEMREREACRKQTVSNVSVFLIRICALECDQLMQVSHTVSWLFANTIMSKHNSFQQKTWLLKLSDRETGAASLCLFSSLYCWAWVNAYMPRLGSKDVLNEYLPCSSVSGADFEQICNVEIEILCAKSLLFHASIDFKFYDFHTCQYAIFCHSRENFVFVNR